MLQIFILLEAGSQQEAHTTFISKHKIRGSYRVFSKQPGYVFVTFETWQSKAQSQPSKPNYLSNAGCPIYALEQDTG